MAARMEYMPSTGLPIQLHQHIAGQQTAAVRSASGLHAADHDSLPVQRGSETMPR